MHKCVKLIYKSILLFNKTIEEPIKIKKLGPYVPNTSITYHDYLEREYRRKMRRKEYCKNVGANIEITDSYRKLFKSMF